MGSRSRWCAAREKVKAFTARYPDVPLLIVNPDGTVYLEETPMGTASMQEIGRLGGLQRARNLTPAQRSEAARKAVKARWAKRRRYVRRKLEGA